MYDGIPYSNNVTFYEMQCIKLASGNLFVMLSTDNDTRVPIAVVLSPVNKDNLWLESLAYDYVFVGGFTCAEALRKEKVVSKYRDITYVEVGDIDMKRVDFRPFLTKLGRYGAAFENYIHVEITDQHAQLASACSSRWIYFDVVGMKSFYEGYARCPIWAVLANHVSIFGINKFAMTFAKNDEVDASANFITESVFKLEHKYSKASYYTPAVYLLRASRKLYNVSSA